MGAPPAPVTNSTPARTGLPPVPGLPLPNLDPDLAKKVADAKRMVESMQAKHRILSGQAANPYLVSPSLPFSSGCTDSSRCSLDRQRRRRSHWIPPSQRGVDSEWPLILFSWTTRRPLLRRSVTDTPPPPNSPPPPSVLHSAPVESKTDSSEFTGQRSKRTTEVQRPSTHRRRQARYAHRQRILRHSTFVRNGRYRTQRSHGTRTRSTDDEIQSAGKVREDGRSYSSGGEDGRSEKEDSGKCAESWAGE